MWRARAAVMAMVAVAAEGRYWGAVERGCVAALGREKEVCGMAVGTVLRAASRPGGGGEGALADEEKKKRVAAFLESDERLVRFARPALAKALMHFDAVFKKQVRDRYSRLQSERKAALVAMAVAAEAAEAAAAAAQGSGNPM